jgi:hypothetical protein
LTILLAGAVCTALVACGSHEDGDATAGGAWSVPEDLRIEVFVAGLQTDMVDANRLGTIPPTYEDEDRKAWRLGIFFGEGFTRGDALLEVGAQDGTRSRFANPARVAEGEELVLSVNRKGEVVVAQVAIDDPFPRYHGRGGNRGRTTGDDRRSKAVVRLSLTHGGAGGGRAGRTEGDGPMLRLQAMVDGEERIWTEDDLFGVDALTVPGDSGQGTRDAWSVRELLSSLVGPDAVLQSVAGEGGGTASIEAAVWRDEARIPVLRLNRKGQFKFHWVGPDLTPLAGDEVRLVRTLVISSR